MSLPALASIADVQVRVGRDLTESEHQRVVGALLDASASVRGYTGQQFTVGSTTWRTRLPRDGRLHLPQRPVQSITSVRTITGTDIVHLWDGLDGLDVWWAMTIVNGPWARVVPVVDVTYEFGYDEIPEDIVGVTAQVVARALGTSPDQSGITQESIGGYSYQLGSTAAAGAFGFLPSEREVLDRYRRVGGVARTVR